MDPEGCGQASRISDTRVNSLALSPVGGLFVAGALMGTVQFGATNVIGNAIFDTFVTHITDPDTPPPTLQIARVADGVSLNWPAAAVGFVLERTDSLLHREVGLSRRAPKSPPGIRIQSP